MNNLYAILFVFISLILFGSTSLLIFGNVRKKNYDLVNTTAKDSWLGQTVNFGKYYQVYKVYYELNGWNLILILNIVSYPSILISIFWFLNTMS